MRDIIKNYTPGNKWSIFDYDLFFIIRSLQETNSSISRISADFLFEHAKIKKEGNEFKLKKKKFLEDIKKIKCTSNTTEIERFRDNLLIFFGEFNSKFQEFVQKFKGIFENFSTIRMKIDEIYVTSKENEQKGKDLFNERYNFILGINEYRATSSSCSSESNLKEMNNNHTSATGFFPNTSSKKLKEIQETEINQSSMKKQKDNYFMTPMARNRKEDNKSHFRSRSKRKNELGQNLISSDMKKRTEEITPKSNFNYKKPSDRECLNQIQEATMEESIQFNNKGYSLITDGK